MQNNTYIEKVWVEYVEYREHLKSIIKTEEELRKSAGQKITEKTTEEQVVDIYLEQVYKQTLMQADFREQQLRLFYTVEALKDQLEIPQEILDEVKGMKFMQIFAVKNNKTEVIDNQALEFSKQQIKNVMSQGIEQFKNSYL